MKFYRWLLEDIPVNRAWHYLNEAILSLVAFVYIFDKYLG